MQRAWRYEQAERVAAKIVDMTGSFDDRSNDRCATYIRAYMATSEGQDLRVQAALLRWKA